MNQFLKFFIILLSISTVAGCGEVSNKTENIVTEEITNEEALILTVKNGILEDYSKPETRIEDAFSNFFRSPNWRCTYLEQSEEGLSGIVEFDGYYTTEDQGSVEFRITFKVLDEEDKYFMMDSLYMNDVIQDDGMKNRLASAIYEKMYSQESISEEQDVVDLQSKDIQNNQPDWEYEMGSIGAVVSDYVIQLAESVNSGNPSHVQGLLYSNSDFYSQQIDLVNNLYSKGIKEYVLDNQILEIRQLSDDKFEVDSYEQIEIVTQGIGEVKEFNWTYTVVYDGTGYYISNLK